MGFRSLISASKLAAAYDSSSKQLILYAEGKVQEFTYGIAFVQDVSFSGGLKFNLEGWTGPLKEPVSFRQYKYQQSFSIVLPSTITNSKSLFITDLENASGIEVPISYLGANDAIDFDKNGVVTDVVEKLETGLLTNYKVLHGELHKPFQIRQTATIPPLGSINLKYDPHYMELLNAQIINGEMEWTFKSIKEGNTQVIVNINGGNVSFATTIVYEVRIFVFPLVKQPLPAAILNFSGRVNLAVRLVRDKYPNAQVYEVDGVPSNGYTIDPLDIDKLKVVFRTGGGGTAIIQSTGWGEFGAIQYISESWLEDVVIPWPLQLDLAEADKLIKAAGYISPYTTTTLRWSLYPGIKQPSYIFGLQTGEYIFVGVYDRKVTAQVAAKQTTAVV